MSQRELSCNCLVAAGRALSPSAGLRRDHPTYRTSKSGPSWRPGLCCRSSVDAVAQARLVAARPEHAPVALGELDQAVTAALSVTVIDFDSAVWAWR